MSDSDSFINEVTEEVRRDRLFATLRRYGWIAILIVLLIVGGAAWREYSKAQATAQARAFGDAILAALAAGDEAARIAALQAVEAPTPGGRAVLELLTAAEQGSTGREDEAVARLRALAEDGEIPAIYRQIATFKALTRGAEAIPAEERQAGFQALATPGQPLRLLAEEQLALLEIEAGDREAAIARLQGVIEDSEVTAGLRRRAAQLIVALGGTPGTGG